MKKIILFAAIAAIFSGFAMAQEPDLELIAKMREIKADSVSLMLGKVYGTQTAMTNPTAEARQALLKAFSEAMTLDQQDEAYRDGANTAEQFYRNAESVNRQLGINMSRKTFAQTFLNHFMDTTTVKNMNGEMNSINMEAKRLMEEIRALKNDSAAAITQASLIDLKADSLSQNMGRFFGTQMQNMSKKKNLSEEQIARFVEGFNSTINIDEADKPLVDGKLLASDFRNIEQSIKKQLNLKLNKDAFVAALTAELNDPKVPTMEEFKAVDAKTQAFMKETQAYIKENGPEALTQKGLGKKYIENQMEKDPKFIQAPSGLVYKIINPGNGKKFNETDKIKVMYKGTHVDGTTFDESKEPVSFAPNQVVPGFKEALLMMSPGAKMIAILPYNLAYGDRGAGQSIKPFETLVFEIETLGIDDSAPVAKPSGQDTPKIKDEVAKPDTLKKQKKTATKSGKKTAKKRK
ncbi:MAG: FKBP-type peptidyl-prolyl cis-trans isomerase [Muribaculaceae bacterium]|nr:FKBP-type peptidyl-prolyl cis-trans isomerase [Muribaculaceae bacterium]